MVNPFRRLAKWIRRVMQSRKRKQDMESTGSASSLDDEDPDNSGDGCPLPKRFYLSSVEDLPPVMSAIGDNEHPHQVSATLGPVICNQKGVSVHLETYQSNSCKEKIHFRVECPYGDFCEDRLGNSLPHTRDRNKKVATGQFGVDSILGNMSNKGYEHLHVYSSGRYGSVILTFSHADSKHKVLKFPVKSKVRNPASRSVTRDEAYILDQLNHPNIIELLKFQHFQGQAILHLEYCENGNLHELLCKQLGRVISEGSARKYFKALTDGLEYIHSQCIVHLDIRPENLLINSHDQLKISDFGDAGFYQIGDPLYVRPVGMIGYKAPEVIQYNVSYNPRYVDIWAAGCVLYRSIFGSAPFQPTCIDSTLDLIKRGVRRTIEENPIHCSQQLNQLLDKILKFIPEARCSLKCIQQDIWLNTKHEKVHISGMYMMGNLQKSCPGQVEMIDKTYQSI